eukprot:jgi/Ulvmu1/1520/UM011_0250.1
MPPAKVHENELLKQELSTSVAERACELAATSVASRTLPQYPRNNHASSEAGNRFILPKLKMQSYDRNAHDSIPNSKGQMSAFHLNRKTKKIMSLPCTVVSSANGVREILDLTRLHYVTHRLALGQSGMKELVAAEKKILGHSSIEDSANLSVFAIPVMDFEEGGLHSTTSRIAGSLLANDPLVLKHTQAMDATIEAIRADRLAQVQIMDSQKFHTLRRNCLDNMTERALLLDAALQDVVIDGINRTEDIVIHNPGYDDLENGRLKLRMTSLHSAAPSVLVAAEKSSSTACTAPTEEDSNTSVKKIRFVADSAAGSRATLLGVPPGEQGSSEDPLDDCQGFDAGMPGQAGATKWTTMRQGVSKMTERWQYVERFRRHGKRKVQLSMADMVGRNNMQTHFLSGAQHAGMFVYISRCKELGVVPTSRVLEAMATERADMNYARLGDRGVEALSYALAVNRIVKGLYLKHCQVTHAGIKHLFQSLLVRVNAEGARELLEAAIDDTVYYEEAATQEQSSNASRTRQRYRSLASLNPASNVLGPRRPPVGTREFKPHGLEAHDLPPVLLKALDISGNPVGLQGAAMAACFLDPRRSPQQLFELTMDACGITDRGGTALVRVACTHTWPIRKIGHRIHT